jgi:hypothetical protein
VEWIGRLWGTTVGLDTAPLIYFVERTGRHDLAREFRDIPVRFGSLKAAL